MKKFFAFALFTVFLISASLSVKCYADGNEDAAVKYQVVAMASLGAGSLGIQKQVTTLGFVSKSYFTDNPMDRPLTRAEKALWDYLSGNDSKKETVRLLQNGELKIETYAESLMFTIPISTGGRRDLLNASSNYFEGRIPQEWHQGSLPVGFNIAVSHVRLGYATDAVATVPEDDVDYVTQPNSWPAALRNSLIIISQNGAVVQQFRSKFAGTQAASTNRSVEGDGLEFQRPFILEEQKGTKIEIYSPQGVTFPSTPAGLFLEIALYGAAVRPIS
jgi:hypothetical protein